MNIFAIVGSLITGAAIRIYGLVAAVYVGTEAGRIIETSLERVNSAFPI